MKGWRVLRESEYSHLDESPQFWFNLKTLKVEVGPQGKAKDRIGPFNTAEDAKNALKTVSERSKSWKESEEKSD